MIEIKRVKTYPLKKRQSKVTVDAFAKPHKNNTFKDFYQSLPKILAAADLHSVVNAVASAHKQKKIVLFMMGAHVIKCGLNPLIIDLINKGVISAVAMNGAGIIHDFEIAYGGQTSEDVGKNIHNGSFGMARETGLFLNSAINEGAQNNLGIAVSIGKKMQKENLTFRHLSIIYNCLKKNIPITVHVAIGTDIIHQHPNFDGALTGKAAQTDFYSLAETISHLQNGVVLNFGSAVILPEVFIKALNIARNLGAKVNNFVTANFDMIHHYRPQQNIVARPTASGGKGFYIIGHHEIMLPLLYNSIISQLHAKP